MIHKCLDDPKMNLINYMSSGITGYTFLGFIEIQKDDYWGIKVGERTFAACHLLNERSTWPVSEEEGKEQKFIDSGHNTVLYFKGTDNTSYLKRFKSKDSAIKWFYKTKVFITDNSSCWVNS